MQWLPPLTILALILTPIAILYYVRNRAMRALALRLGFRYIGRPLPDSFYLRGYPLNAIGWARNVIQGEQAGIPILIFDCYAGTGKGAPYCTVIAAQTSINPFPEVSPPEKITKQRAWTAVYRTRYPLIPWTLSTDRIEELLNNLQGSPTRRVAQVSISNK
jgi:hypothetical protein